MASVTRFFDDYDTADKAVEMLVQRKYPAETIAVVMRDENGRLRALSGVQIEVDTIGDSLGLGRLVDWLTGGLDEPVDDMGAALARVGVLPELVLAHAARIDAGQVLVSVTTEDFRASDVANILDAASGRLLEYYEQEPPTEEGGGDVTD